MRTYFPVSIFIFLVVFFSCDQEKPTNPNSENTESIYLNHSDTARYVGKETCRLCHQQIYDSFIKTGMGQSFDVASRTKSAASFEHAIVYDKVKDMYYQSFFANDSLYIKEFRLRKKDTIHELTKAVKYIIGSGQHTNSHITSTNGYVTQMPMTFYTQEGRWDLPPGFEAGGNSRFERKIGLECMTCHNAYPQFTAGSENKYTLIPTGIDCERCHGPGSIHVAEKSKGNKVDTSKQIDYTIVNPAKLPIDLQFDVCQRCHLQGNTVLKDGKSFFDFKPGMKLSEYMSVFLPKYANAEKDFIMASHADRLKMSECFIMSFKPSESSTSLKPYKQALTCVTCHDPHVSVKVTDHQKFNTACSNCHSQTASVFCSEKETVRAVKKNDCVSCHMPKSGSTDIPHVRVTDHFIRKPVKQEQVVKIKTFLGLFAVNENAPDNRSKARAYLNQYEKFESNLAFLDSAKYYLPDEGTAMLENFELLVHLCFLKNEFDRISSLVERYGKEKALAKLVKKQLSNDDAWTCYRIGEALYKTNKKKDAFVFYKQASELAPYNLDFKNKLGATYAGLGNPKEGKVIFESILKENPDFVPALTNLGFIQLMEGAIGLAENTYERGYKLNPDYIPLLLNLAGLRIYQNDRSAALSLIDHVLKLDPKNAQAKMIIDQLKRKG